MRIDDTRAIKEIISPNRWSLPKPMSFVVHSPCSWELEMIHEAWPYASITTIGIDQWNLNDPPPEGLSADVFMISGTMMYSPNPDLWLNHISMVSQTVVMQDLCRVRRHGSQHCTSDGDCMRYSVTNHGLVGQNDPERTVFDLSTSTMIEEMVDIIDYGDEEPGQPEFKKFVTVIKLRKGSR